MLRKLIAYTKVQQDRLRTSSRHLNSFHTLPKGNNFTRNILWENNMPWFFFFSTQVAWNEQVGPLILSAVTDHCFIPFILIDFRVWQSCCLAGRWKLKIQSHDRSSRKPKKMKATGGWSLWCERRCHEILSGIAQTTQLNSILPWVWRCHVKK